MKLIRKQSAANGLLGLHKSNSDYLTCRTHKWFYR